MSGDVTTNIHLLTHTTDGRTAWSHASTLSKHPISNFALPLTRLTIHDLRGKETSVRLDVNAFELGKYDGSVNDEFEEGSEAQRIYYDEIKAFLKSRLGATRVIIYNFICRSRGARRPDDQCDDKHKNANFSPHVDVDTPGVILKVKELLGEDELKKIMQKRFQIINIWRPMGPNPIINKPLAICDYSSVDIENDVHPLEVQASENTATAYTISCKIPNSQRWYYLSEMRSDEMFIMKMFDSKSDVAKYAFHTAFINEQVPPSDPDQKSIDVRCLVLYDQ